MYPNHGLWAGGRKVKSLEMSFLYNSVEVSNRDRPRGRWIRGVKKKWRVIAYRTLKMLSVSTIYAVK